MLRLSGVVLLCLVFLPGSVLAQDQPPMTDTPEVTPPPSLPPPAPPPAADPEPTPAPPPAAAAPAADPDSPVVRAEAKNMGMYFRFGGLANLTHSNNSRNVGPLLFSQVGMKFVFSEKLMLPIWFGTGIRVDNPDDGIPATNEDSATNWGIDLGVGIEYHFRIWRRISPFIGGQFGFNVQDPTQDDNIQLGVGLGPVMGVEYYVADRVSVTAMYMFTIQIGYQDAPDGAISTTTFGLSTLAGGALNITYYF